MGILDLLGSVFLNCVARVHSTLQVAGHLADRVTNTVPQATQFLPKFPFGRGQTLSFELPESADHFCRLCRQLMFGGFIHLATLVLRLLELFVSVSVQLRQLLGQSAIYSVCRFSQHRAQLSALLRHQLQNPSFRLLLCLQRLLEL